MMTELSIKLYSIEKDGLPDVGSVTGKLAFIFDGCIVSGWPDVSGDPSHWEANSDVGHIGTFTGITHYVIFSHPLYSIK